MVPSGAWWNAGTRVRCVLEVCATTETGALGVECIGSGFVGCMFGDAFQNAHHFYAGKFNNINLFPTYSKILSSLTNNIIT